jgi:transcriptional regulator with XRE-family HTH domain
MGDMVKAKTGFGVRLRALREEAGWSLQELGDRLGITKMGLARLEWGKREPRLSTVVAVADCFGLAIDDLLGRTPPRRRPGHK